MEQIEETIDFTQDISEESGEVAKLKQEIAYLESQLKIPVSIKSMILLGTIGYIMGSKYIGENGGVIGSALGGYAGINLGKRKELTTEQKHIINQAIIDKQKRLESLGVEIKGEQYGVLSADELQSLDYEKYAFDGDYVEFIGKPAIGFHALVYGLPKSGKSIWSMQFADYLANNFGKVMYVACEEQFKGTLKEKVKDWTTNRSHLDFGKVDTFEEINKLIQGYNFVIIDSLDYADVSVEEMEQLKRNHPKTSFVTIKQVTKDGQFRGSQEYAHNCDIIISISDGQAYQKGRFNGGGQMSVFEREIDENNEV